MKAEKLFRFGYGFLMLSVVLCVSWATGPQVQGVEQSGLLVGGVDPCEQAKVDEDECEDDGGGCLLLYAKAFDATGMQKKRITVTDTADGCKPVANTPNSGCIKQTVVTEWVNSTNGGCTAVCPNPHQ